MLKSSRITLLPGWYYKGEDKIFRYSDVKVSLNGNGVDVIATRESAVPFNRVWPGRQRSLDQTELAGLVNFSADEPVKVKVEVAGDRDFEKAVIRPLSKNIKPLVNGREVTFTLTELGQYVLELGTYHNLVYFFFDPVEDIPQPDEVEYFFGPGIHFPGVINLKSSDRVYIDRDAIVFGNILGINVKDVRIFGGGILNGGAENRIFGGFTENYTKSTLKFYNSDNIRIEGIIIQDSASWTTSCFACSNVFIDRVKVVGQWRYNTDGMDFCNTSHLRISNSFIRAFDDGIVLKGYDEMPFETIPEIRRGRIVDDVAVENCIVWSGWGRTLEVGIETCASEFKDILFENCDLVHNSATCLDVQNGNYAFIHDVTFRNIRVEYQAETLPEIIQKSDDDKYDAAGRMGVPKLLNVDNHRYGGQTGKFGDTSDILFEDIQVFAEEGVPEKLPVFFGNFNDEVKVENITVRNLTINGKKISSPESVEVGKAGKVDNIRWE